MIWQASKHHFLYGLSRFNSIILLPTYSNFLFIYLTKSCASFLKLCSLLYIVEDVGYILQSA